MRLFGRKSVISSVVFLMALGLSNGCSSSADSDDDVEASADNDDIAVSESDMAADATDAAQGDEQQQDVAADAGEVALEEVQTAEPVTSDAEQAATDAPAAEAQTYDMETPNVPSAPVEQEEVAAVSEPYPETAQEQLADTATKIENDSAAMPEAVPQPVVDDHPKKSKHHNSSWSDTSSSASDKHHAEYVVVPGDTLGSIAVKIYGSTHFWQKLANSSNLSNPHRIFPGDVVVFEKTGRGKKFASEYKNLPREKVTVERGDTLGEISKKVFGSENLWKVLWKYNRHKIKNPNRIHVGMTLSYIALNGVSAQPSAEQADVPAPKKARHHKATAKNRHKKQNHHVASKKHRGGGKSHKTTENQVSEMPTVGDHAPAVAAPVVEEIPATTDGEAPTAPAEAH